MSDSRKSNQIVADKQKHGSGSGANRPGLGRTLRAHLSKKRSPEQSFPLSLLPDLSNKPLAWQVRVFFRSAVDANRPVNPKVSWELQIIFECRDLSSTMKTGLAWSSGNIRPELGYVTGTKDTSFAKTHAHKRVWQLAEYPEHSLSVSSWIATVLLFTNSIEVASHFDLNTLGRHHIFAATARAKDTPERFLFTYIPSSPERTFNCWDGSLHPHNGSWWIFPMTKNEERLEENQKKETPLEQDRVLPPCYQP